MCIRDRWIAAGLPQGGVAPIGTAALVFSAYSVAGYLHDWVEKTSAAARADG